MSSEEKKREILSNPEKIKPAQYGGSDFLRIPKSWKSFKELKRPIDLIFDATIEKNENGQILLVFKRLPKK